jgi:lysozyme family protein
MINKFNEFLLEKEFNSILDDIFRIVEDVEGKWTSPNTIEWDYSDDNKIDDEKRTFEWEIEQKNPDFIEKNLNKVKDFINKIPKEKISHYFIKLLNNLKSLPERLRRFLIIHYTSVFLAVASLSTLLSGGEVEKQNKTKENEISNTDTVKTDTIKIDPIVLKEVKELSNKSSFHLAQKSVKEVEAGYSDDRGDTGNYIEVPGGKRFLGTNHGISAPVLHKYLQDKGIKKLPTKEDMKNLSYETALEIYKKDYWDAQNLSEVCNQNIANIIYDGCVNQGVTSMNAIITKSLLEQGYKIKGWTFKKENIKKINSCNQKKLFKSIKKYREERYREARTFNRHGSGWLNRLDGIEYQDLT